MSYRTVCLAAIAAVALSALLAGPASALSPTDGHSGPQSSTIAVIGDIPYGDTKLAQFPADIVKINSDPDVSLVAHLGDIKNGSSACSDEYFSTIRADFDMFQDPLVYTPGDNEWTDCHRANNGGYVPTERLAKLRQVFFPEPGHTLGAHPQQVTTQAADRKYGQYVENTMWHQSGVVFSSVNIPGSNNDLVPWFGVTPLSQAQQDEHDQRLAADLKWIGKAFESAMETHARGVVLLMQADMWDTSALAPGGDGLAGFDPIVAQTGTLAKNFHGPVLILQGDSHAYRVDHPFTATDPLYGIHPLHPANLEAPNVTRVVVDGSSAADNYLKLSINSATPDLFGWTRVPY